MALYMYSTYLQQVDHQAFKTIHSPGDITPYSGIYRCEGCGHEIVSTHGHPLPPQNHHQHTYQQGSIHWRLVVTHQSN
jgi:hypothetical protein